MSDTELVTAEPFDANTLREFIEEHEVGVNDVLAAYDGAEAAYARAVGSSWTQSMIVSGSTTPQVRR